MLAVIPSVFVVAVLLGNLLATAARAAILGGSLVAALATVDALVSNPPVEGR